MRALRVDNVPISIPSLPVARLVGHEGPIQAVCFTCKRARSNLVPPQHDESLDDDMYLALGLISQRTTTEILYIPSL
jgi:hypothetical protein